MSVETQGCRNDSLSQEPLRWCVAHGVTNDVILTLGNKESSGWTDEVWNEEVGHHLFHPRFTGRRRSGLEGGSLKDCRCLLENSTRGPVKRPNLNFLKMTRFCLLSSPKADVKLQGSVQHFVSVEYALGRFELIMRSCALQTVVFNLYGGSELRMHFREERETQGSCDIQN
ncbi:hypothetical protein QQF64_021367 [Cirrhinus molitorella]|uniref:Uncharacterized protein n=1 Tax=Cirrhinus molitorella TaxID=172907 RepID=A0ABR3LFA0_9TELE